jgi:hypothetical protein
MFPVMAHACFARLEKNGGCAFYKHLAPLERMTGREFGIA